MDAKAQEAAIAERLGAVRAEIAAAADRAGRDPGAVRLVVVTKGHSVRTIRAAYACGLRLLGENRVDEAAPKLVELADLVDAEWHLIGPLQSRKVGLVGDGFRLLHAVDRLKIARLLDLEASAHGRRQDILLECNVSGEVSKAGWWLDSELGWDGAVTEIGEVARMANLRLCGLMTMAPQTEQIDVQRRTFRRLAAVQGRLENELALPLPELSMGMSDDFPTAVEEGATIVRIGRAILGERM